MRINRAELATEIPILIARSSIVVDESMIDPYGNHLNHALGLRIFEKQRLGILEVHGIAPATMGEKLGVLFFVHDVEATYKRQAFLGDKLQVDSELYRKAVTLIFHHRLHKKDDPVSVIDAYVTLAAASSGLNARMARIPESLIELFKKSPSEIQIEI